MFKNYIDSAERKEANKQSAASNGRRAASGSGSGLGVLALIFEIAADAFSVAAYQTLLAIHGASGYHQIAILAFIFLSALLLLGIVPAYKAGSYLRPNAGGSGPLVEAIGPARMRWLSWVGTSLFFLDAVLTIIISSISAADVSMLVMPELAAYRILLAELSPSLSWLCWSHWVRTGRSPLSSWRWRLHHLHPRRPRPGRRHLGRSPMGVPDGRHRRSPGNHGRGRGSGPCSAGPVGPEPGNFLSALLPLDGQRHAGILGL